VRSSHLQTVGPHVVFSERPKHLSGRLSGDGLTDIAASETVRFDIGPNLGFGRFESKN